MIEKITNIVKELDELDDMINSLVNELSYQDSRICDLEHFIENNPINSKSAYRLVKELKVATMIRREVKENMEIGRVFNTHKNKLLQKDNRKMLLTELHKCESKLQKDYKNRVYKVEEMNYLLGKEEDVNEIF